MSFVRILKSCFGSDSKEFDIPLLSAGEKVSALHSIPKNRLETIVNPVRNVFGDFLNIKDSINLSQTTHFFHQEIQVTDIDKLIYLRQKKINRLNQPDINNLEKQIFVEDARILRGEKYSCDNCCDRNCLCCVKMYSYAPAATPAAALHSTNYTLCCSTSASTKEGANSCNVDRFVYDAIGFVSGLLIPICVMPPPPLVLVFVASGVTLGEIGSATRTFCFRRKMNRDWIGTPGYQYYKIHQEIRMLAKLEEELRQTLSADDIKAAEEKIKSGNIKLNFFTRCHQKAVPAPASKDTVNSNPPSAEPVVLATAPPSVPNEIDAKHSAPGLTG